MNRFFKIIAQFVFFNKLGIGAQGLGGLTTVLDVKIMDFKIQYLCFIPPTRTNLEFLADIGSAVELFRVPRPVRVTA